MITKRILRINLEVNGRVLTYSNLAMTIQGTRFTNYLPTSATISILNMNLAELNEVVSEANNFRSNRRTLKIDVFAGRADAEPRLLYRGYIYRASVAGETDRLLIMQTYAREVTSNIITTYLPGELRLSKIAERLAQREGLSLDMRIPDKLLTRRYSYTGPHYQELRYLSRISGTYIYKYKDTLVIDNDVYNRRAEGRPRVVITGRDIINIPDLTETGISLTTLFDQPINIDDVITLKSTRLQYSSGDWIVYKQDFNLSNRDTPWYLTNWCREPILGR